MDYSILTRIMSNSKFKVSFCIGVYNEEKVLLSQIEKIKKSLCMILGKLNYEIVIVENGSLDRTLELLNGLDDKNIKVITLGKKGHGLAFKSAIENSTYNNLVLSAIDIPFGFDDLKIALAKWVDYDIIFGSKAHSRSHVDVAFQRKIASGIYRLLLNFFFGLKIKDTQGSVFIKKNKIIPILKFCNAKNAFFTAQIAIYGRLAGLKMTEIPVCIKKEKIRDSKYSILRDGAEMLLSLANNYLFIKKGTAIFKN